MIRPEDVEVGRAPVCDPASVAIRGEVVEAVYLGDAIKLVVAVGGGTLAAKLSGRRGTEFSPGDPVTVCWPRSATRILPAAAPGAPD
jgi:ABC-type Fe3+/spermidine/putrescine transport system ATPase subunit